jgi:hypothetical protein
MMMVSQTNLTIVFFLLFLVYFDIEIIYSAAQDDFRIERTNLLTDSNGYMHIFGELKNISDEPKRNIIIYATFVDANGISLANASAGTAVRSLNQGYTSPFELLLLNKDAAKNVTNYFLQFKSETGLEKNYSLQLTSAEHRLDIYGFYHINGKVLNQANDTATNSLVISSFYDHNGTILDISKALTEPLNITAGNEASFSIVMDNRERSYKIKNFALIIDSDQYVSLQ